jgi:hypothetical protein
MQGKQRAERGNLQIGESGEQRPHKEQTVGEDKAKKCKRAIFKKMSNIKQDKRAISKKDGLCVPIFHCFSSFFSCT